jgi:tetratricopeptide (TPR) repeat protein
MRSRPLPLTNEEASDFTAREQLADAYRLMSWIERSTGNIAAALDSNQKALRNMQLLQKAGRLNDSALGKLASVTVLEGLLQADSQQLEQARRAWEQAEGLLSDRAATTHSPSILDPWARILMLSGRNAEAEKILQELSVGGYRPLQPWPEVAH